MNHLDATRLMFGIHALHGACQLVLQEQGQTPDGRYLTMVVGVMVTAQNPLSQAAQDLGACQELIIGDAVIRPHGKFSGLDHVGDGAGCLLTSDALFPEGWSVQTLDNGFSSLHPKSQISGKR